MLGNIAGGVLGAALNGTGIGSVLGNVSGLDTGFDIGQMKADNAQLTADKLALMESNHNNQMATLAATTQFAIEGSAIKESLEQQKHSMDYANKFNQNARAGALDFLDNMTA